MNKLNLKFKEILQKIKSLDKNKKIALAILAMILSILILAGVVFVVTRPVSKINIFKNNKVGKVSSYPDFISSYAASYPTSYITDEYGQIVNNEGNPNVENPNIPEAKSKNSWYYKSEDPVKELSISNRDKVKFMDYGFYLYNDNEGKYERVITDIPVFDYVISSTGRYITFRTYYGMEGRALNISVNSQPFYLATYEYDYETKSVYKVGDFVSKWLFTSPNDKYLLFRENNPENDAELGKFLFRRSDRSRISINLSIDLNYNDISGDIAWNSEETLIAVPNQYGPGVQENSQINIYEITGNSANLKKIIKLDNYLPTMVAGIRNNDLFAFSVEQKSSGFCNTGNDNCSFKLIKINISDNSVATIFTSDEKNYGFMNLDNNRFIYKKQNNEWELYSYNGNGSSKLSTIDIPEYNDSRLNSIHYVVGNQLVIAGRELCYTDSMFGNVAYGSFIVIDLIKSKSYYPRKILSDGKECNIKLGGIYSFYGDQIFVTEESENQLGSYVGNNRKSYEYNPDTNTKSVLER